MIADKNKDTAKSQQTNAELMSLIGAMTDQIDSKRPSLEFIINRL